MITGKCDKRPGSSRLSHYNSTVRNFTCLDVQWKQEFGRQSKRKGTPDGENLTLKCTKPQDRAGLRKQSVSTHLKLDKSSGDAAVECGIRAHIGKAAGWMPKGNALNSKEI